MIFLGFLKNNIIERFAFYNSVADQAKKKIDWKLGNANVGILYAGSMKYGTLFQKTHLFMESDQLLGVDTVNHIFTTSVTSADVLPGIRPIIIQPKLSVIKFIEILVFVLFLSLRGGIKNLRGAIWILINLYKIKSWSPALAELNLRALVIDYEVNTSKSLLLACNALGLPTVGFQERPELVFSNIYGCILDSYLVAGEVFSSACASNDMFIVGKQISVGQWRTSFFSDHDVGGILPRRRSTSEALTGDIRPIGVFGWFLDFEIPSPIINEKSCSAFLKVVDCLCEAFPRRSVVLRLKFVQPETIARLRGLFSDRPNFILDAAEGAEASYRLAADSECIVAIPTSLVHEALACEIPVVLIDDLDTISEVSTGAYPECYDFCIGRSNQEIIDLVTRICSGNTDLLDSYRQLFEKVRGPLDGGSRHAFTSSLKNEIAELIGS